MAVTAKAVKSLLEDYLCLICQDWFEDPMIIKCGHTFCRICITEYWETFRDNFPCPECRRVFPEITLRPNTHLRNVVKIAKSFKSSEKGQEENRVCEKHQEIGKLFSEEVESSPCLGCRESWGLFMNFPEEAAQDIKQVDFPALVVEQSDGGYQDDYNNLVGSEERLDDVISSQKMDPTALAERSKSYKKAFLKQVEMVTRALISLSLCLASVKNNPGIYEKINDFIESTSQQLSKALALTHVMKQKANSEHLAMLMEKKKLQDKLQRRKMHLRIFRQQCNSYSGLQRESYVHLEKSIGKLTFLEEFLSEMEEQKKICSQSNQSLPSRIWSQLRKRFTGAAGYEKAQHDVKEAVAGANQEVAHWQDNFLSCAKEVEKYFKRVNEEEGRIEDNEKGIQYIKAKVQRSIMLLTNLREMQCGLWTCSQFMALLVKIVPTAAEIIRNVHICEHLIDHLKDIMQSIFLLMDLRAHESGGCEILFNAKIPALVKKRKRIQTDPVCSTQLDQQPNKKQRQNLHKRHFSI